MVLDLSVSVVEGVRDTMRTVSAKLFIYLYFYKLPLLLMLCKLLRAVKS